MVRGRLVCAICFVSAKNGGAVRALADRGSGRLSCRQQLYITRSHKYRHDRFHLYNVAEA
jgi:hypothetical protein